MNDRRTGGAAKAADQRARLVSQTVFDRPLVLEAGAGTGKTATLVARIVAWCLGPGWLRAAEELRAQNERRGKREPVAVDRIAARVLDSVVAITFTEAAAAEMASRIAGSLAELQGGALPTGLLPEAISVPGDEGSERASSLLVALDHLVVATIHAFCRRLLAGVPLEAGLHPNFSVDAEGFVLAEVVQETVESAFRRALAAPERSALFSLAAAGIDAVGVAEALVKLAADGVPPGALEMDPVGPEATAALASQVRVLAHDVCRLVGARFSGTGRTRNAASIVERLEALARVLAAESPPDTIVGLVAAVGEALPENLVSHLANWGNDDFTTSETELLGESRADLVEPAAALAGLARHLTRLQPELLDLARRALAPLLAEVHRAMRTRGAETFSALLRDARDTLARHPAVRARLRSEITQLMVDEFQDTDRVQCEILQLLALDGPAEERPSLFLIGDPKQSIYGWRDADLAAYDSFLDLVREEGGEVMNLSVNFRSAPAILAEVERVVRPVMRHEPGVQPSFQSLLPCDERSAEPEPLVGRAAVEHWVSWTPAPDDPAQLEESSTQAAAELEAGALAADVLELHGNGVPWREFGVLLRSTSDLDVYLQAFRDAGVPYLVERDRSYYRRREVIEAAALVRTVLDPGDHLALVTVLRSSVVGVPDAAFIPLWTRSFPDRASELGTRDGDTLPALRALVTEVAATLPEDVPGIERIAGWERNLSAFLGHLALLRVSFETEAAAVFVEKLRTLTLFEASEAARALGRYRVGNLDRFFRTLLEAIEADSDPHAVLRALRTAVSEVREAEEGRPLAAAEDAVRVMTIHKAKGLDFTHVYLMQAQKRSRGEAPAELDVAEIDDRFEYVLFGAATPGWHTVEERRQRVSAAELVRTLYVAMTRAKDRLVVAGIFPADASPRRSRARSHMDLLSRREIPEGGLTAVAARVRLGGVSHEDGAGARWVFPALGLTPASPEASGPTLELPLPVEVSRQAGILAKLRRDAEARQARAFAVPASAEAHNRLRESLLERADEGEVAPVRASSAESRRTPAAAVGVAVHRVLELLDLDGDLATQIAVAGRSLPTLLEGLVHPVRRREAMERAREVLGLLAGGRLLARLKAIGPNVVARELPVLLPPGADPEAPVGFVSGTIDLVYRDPVSGELVIADYKTDEVATDEEVARRVAAYASQGAAYRRALTEALRLDTEPRFELWFLQGDRIETPGS